MHDLVEIPELPKELKQAVLDGELVIFVGAGVSRLLGCPSWDGLADLVLENLARSEIISFGIVQRLKTLEAKKKLSIAVQIASDKSYSIDYKLLLKHDNTKSKIYSYLNSVGCAYVTTNYDTLLNPVRISKDTMKPVTAKRILKPEDFLAGRLDEPCAVFHLHGCLLDPDTMIVSTKDYLKHYDNRFIVDFLKELFTRHTVLFIGYGFEESEILEHILRNGQIGEEGTRRRFVLQGFYKDESSLYQLLHEYHRSSFGVHLLGFLLDKRDHVQLEYIMQDWVKEFEFRDRLLLDDIEYIEEVLNE